MESVQSFIAAGYCVGPQSFPHLPEDAEVLILVESHEDPTQLALHAQLINRLAQPGDRVYLEGIKAGERVVRATNQLGRSLTVDVSMWGWDTLSQEQWEPLCLARGVLPETLQLRGQIKDKINVIAMLKQGPAPHSRLGQAQLALERLISWDIDDTEKANPLQSSVARLKATSRCLVSQLEQLYKDVTAQSERELLELRAQLQGRADAKIIEQVQQELMVKDWHKRQHALQTTLEGCTGIGRSFVICGMSHVVQDVCLEPMRRHWAGFLRVMEQSKITHGESIKWPVRFREECDLAPIDLALPSWREKKITVLLSHHVQRWEQAGLPMREKLEKICAFFESLSPELWLVHLLSLCLEVNPRLGKVAAWLKARAALEAQVSVKEMQVYEAGWASLSDAVVKL